MSQLLAPIVTLPAQTAIQHCFGGQLNSGVIQNRQTNAGEYIDVWIQDAQPDPQDTSGQFFFRIQPGTALMIDPFDTANEESTRKISVQKMWYRGNAVSNPAYMDVIWTTKYAVNQQPTGYLHPIQV